MNLAASLLSWQSCNGRHTLLFLLGSNESTDLFWFNWDGYVPSAFWISLFIIVEDETLVKIGKTKNKAFKLHPSTSPILFWSRDTSFDLIFSAILLVSLQLNVLGLGKFLAWFTAFWQVASWQTIDMCATVFLEKAVQKYKICVSPKRPWSWYLK